MNSSPSYLPIRGIMINAKPIDYQNLPIYPHNELILVDMSAQPSFLPKGFPPLMVHIKKGSGSIIYLQDIIQALNKMYGGYRFSMRLIGGAPRLSHHIYGIQRVTGTELSPKSRMPYARN